VESNLGSSPQGKIAHVLRERGRLLLQEGAEDIRKRSRTYVRSGTVFSGTGIAITLVGLGALEAGIAGVFLRLFAAVLPIFGLALAIIGGVMMRAAKRLKPIGVYENGIEGSSMTGASMFFSYGELTSVEEITDPLGGAHYLFRTSGSMPAIAIRQDMPHFAGLLDSIRPKLGNADFLVKLDSTPAEIRAARRFEYGMYAAALLLGLTAAAMFSAATNPADPLFVFLSGVGLVAALFVMPLLAGTAYFMKVRPKGSPTRLNIKVPTLIVIVMVMYFFASGAVFSNAFGPSPDALHIGPKPSSSSIAAGTYENRTLRAEGNVLVDTGQTLEFRNTTLILNLTSDKQFGIWIAGGGMLVLENSSVFPADARYLYTFEIMGSAVIRNSTISGLWGEWDDYDGGLEIYSDSVWIESSQIQYSRQTAILVIGSSPLIANSTIRGAGDDGIEMQASNARVLNNQIQDCEWGMYVYRGSRPLIEGNLIANNAFGILSVDSSPVIRGNRFENNEHIAISYRGPAVPVLAGNTYVGNGENVSREADLGFLNIWTILTIGTAVACLIALMRVNRTKPGGTARSTVGKVSPPHL